MCHRLPGHVCRSVLMADVMLLATDLLNTFADAQIAQIPEGVRKGRFLSLLDITLTGHLLSPQSVSKVGIHMLFMKKLSIYTLLWANLTLN